MKLILRIALILSLFCCLPFANAQADRGGVSGKITDNTGAILPNAAITLRNEATGVSQTATANSSGDFVFQLLNPGAYTLSVAVPGFKSVERTHINVDVNQVNQQNVEMNIGSTSETVEVTTGVQQLQTESGSLGLIVEQKSIQELPLVYGNPFTLEMLSPGVTFGGVNPNIHSYDSGTANVSVNGSLLNSLEYRLDGAPDNRIRLSAYTPSTEFINQYKVETATYDATEGHSSGGFVNVSLKGGANKFHGGAFGSYQNPTLNTSFWHLGATPPAKSVWLREGGDLGGPIWRDRIFFFGGYEHSREASPNVQTLTVPSDAERTGNFSELYALDPAHPAGTSNLYQLYSPTGAAAVKGGVCGTSKGAPVTCTVRNAIPGNIITNINPIAAAALAYYPHANTTPNSAGGGNYSYSGAEPNYYFAYVTRIDATLTKKQTVFGHYVASRRLQPGKNGYFLPASGTNLTYQNKGVALGYTYAITPATLLDVHGTWTRFVNQNVVSSQDKLNATSIGMPGYLINGLPDAAFSFPRIDITGYDSLNKDNGVLSHDDISLGSIQVSHLIRNHFLRAGFEYRMYNTNAGVTTQSNGRYQNTGTYTTANSLATAPSIGFGLAQFEYGIPTSSAITINSDFAVRSTYLSEYLQDDWKATPNLTLNLGLRFEYEGPNSERNQKANTFFDFNAANPISAAAKTAYATIYAASSAVNPLIPNPANFNVNGGLRFLGDPAQPFGHQTYQAQKFNVLPRIGLSYQVHSNTVLRAGYGFFEDSLSTFYLSGGNSGSTSTFLLPQQGFTQTTSLNSSLDKGLTFPSTLANPFPTGITQPTGNTLGLSTALGQNVTFQPTNPKVPYNMRWSGGVQRQFGPWLAAVDYVGNHGVHLPIQRDYNALPQQYLSTVTNGFDASINTALGLSVPNPFVGLIPSATTTVGPSTLLRPYPEFGSVTAFITSGSSIYHGLQAQLIRRFVHGASLTTAFTWSKSLDSTQYLNASDTRPWYGVSQNDRTFRFATSGIYQIPIGTGRRFLADSGILSQILGGFQVQGVYQVQSGQPLNFNPASTSPLYIGPGDPTQSAWGRNGFKSSSNNLTATGNWFNTANWVKATSPGSITSGVVPNVVPNQFQVRTMPIRFDTLRADFLNQFDAAVQRNFSLSRLYETASVQIRIDAINALNHPVYNTPNTDWTNSAFGQITSQANQPRIYQFEAFIRF